MRVAGCPYCDAPGGRVVWSDARLRVLFIEDAPFVGLCRVVWNDHVKELTDLNDSDRLHVFKVLCVVEEGLRGLLAPDKMNLAALGTQVPHLHWHLIPRFSDDTHYPDPIWAAPLRPRGDRVPPPDFAAVLVGVFAERLGIASAAP